MTSSTAENASFTRADPIMRAFGFLIESAIWTSIWWGVSTQFSFPVYLEWFGTWPVFIIYKTVMLWRFGAHIGHLATGIRIVDYRTGGPISLKQASIRTIPELSYEFFVTAIINIILIFTREDHRHSFDLFAGTIAITSRDPEPSEASYHDEDQNQEMAKMPKTATDPILYRESDRPPF